MEQPQPIKSYQWGPVFDSMLLTGSLQNFGYITEETTAIINTSVNSVAAISAVVNSEFSDTFSQTYYDAMQSLFDIPLVDQLLELGGLDDQLTSLYFDQYNTIAPWVDDANLARINYIFDFLDDFNGRYSSAQPNAENDYSVPNETTAILADAIFRLNTLAEYAQDSSNFGWQYSETYEKNNAIGQALIMNESPLADIIQARLFTNFLYEYTGDDSSANNFISKAIAVSSGFRAINSAVLDPESELGLTLDVIFGSTRMVGNIFNHPVYGVNSDDVGRFLEEAGVGKTIIEGEKPLAETGGLQTPAEILAEKEEAAPVETEAAETAAPVETEAAETAAPVEEETDISLPPVINEDSGSDGGMVEVGVGAAPVDINFPPITHGHAGPDGSMVEGGAVGIQPGGAVEIEQGGAEAAEFDTSTPAAPVETEAAPVEVGETAGEEEPLLNDPWIQWDVAPEKWWESPVSSDSGDDIWDVS